MRLSARNLIKGDVTSLAADGDLYRAGMTSRAGVNLMLAVEDKVGVESPERMLRRRTFETISAIRAAIEDLGGSSDFTG